MPNDPQTILVVEDEKPLLEAIKIKLEKNGFEVETARTIEQAKKYALDTPKIDVIWLDHYLFGKGNGLDFIAWCKQEDNQKCNLIPFFIVSNTASSDKVASYMHLGAKKYFIKANHKLDEIIKDIKQSLVADV
ncbi:MAG: response regulator [Candidatus Falkowbacteria bacterium]|nr:response regulator [Candidatus Falkowbacteria bacterium]